MAAKPIKIAIVANARQAAKEVDGFAGGLRSKLGKVAKWGAVGVAGVGAAAIGVGKQLASAASDAEQSLGATETVFGKYADKVIGHSKRAAENIGLSANEYRELSNVTGALLNGAGLPMKDLAGLTDDLNTRAADMAATFGGTTAEAVEAISSLMKGAGDPIEKYGVSIRQSDVNARLAAKGQDKLTGAQRKQAEMQARVDLLMENTSKTQGQFKRESKTLAGQQQRLTATVDNLKASLGARLLPVLVAVFEWINDTAIPKAKELAGEMRDRLTPYVDKAREGFQKLMDRLEPLGKWLKENPDLIKGAAIALGIAAGAVALFAGAMAILAVVTSPITLIVVAIAAIGGAVYYAYRNSQTFRDALAKVGEIATSVFAWLRDNVGPILTAMGEYFRAAFDRVKSVVTTALDIIKRLWNTHGSTILKFITNTFDNIKGAVEGALDIVQGIIETVTGVIRGDWRKAWDGIKKILSGAWKVITSVVKQAGNIIKTLLSLAWDTVKSLTSKAWDAVKSAVSRGVETMLTKVREIPGKVKGALSDAKEWLKEAGKDVIRGLGLGIEDMKDWIRDQVNKISGWVPKWVKKKLGIASPSKVMRRLARWIPAGMARGIQDGEKGVQKALDKVTKRIAKALDKRYDGKKLAAATKSVMKGLRDEYKALVKNARQHDKVSKKIANARAALKEARKAAREYAASIKASIVDSANITGLDEGHMGSPGAMVDQLRDRVARAERYAELIEQLRGKVNKTTLDQLLAAGVDGGLAAAEALAAGGNATIAEVNALMARLNKTGQALGNNLADQFHGAGIKAAEGLLKGLLKDQKKIEQAAKRLAKALAKAVRKELKIKSPSRVFRDLGTMTTDGLVIGLDEHRVAKAGRSLANGLEDGFGRPTLAAATALNGTGANGAQAPLKVEIHLTADQVSQIERGRRITADVSAYQRAGGRVA